MNLFTYPQHPKQLVLIELNSSIRDRASSFLLRQWHFVEGGFWTAIEQKRTPEHTKGNLEPRYIGSGKMPVLWVANSTFAPIMYKES